MTAVANGLANHRLDAAEVKAAASGQWPAILAEVAGIPADVLDGKNHPCPKCGGTDRFRLIDAEAGAVLCNQCFATGNGDGLAAVQWATGCDFPEAVRLVADRVGMAPSNGCHLTATPQPNGAKPTKTYPTAEAASNAALQSVQRKHPGAKIAGEWTYRTETGEVFGACVRIDTGGTDPATGKPAKEFRPIRQQDFGEWIIGKGAGAWPLYGVDRLRPDGVVVVVEGEKAADVLRGVEVNAVTWQGGSKAVPQADWSPLTGRDVAVWPDADDAGEAAVEALSVALSGLEPPATLRRFGWPDAPDKGDAVECLNGWTDADGAYHPGYFGDAATPEVIAETIAQWAADGELVEPTADDEPENPFRREPVAKSTLRQLVADYLTLKPAVVDGLIREGETCNIVSTSKVGKSWLVYNLALSIVTGRDWLDTYGTAPGRVLLIDNELHRATLASRIPTVAAAMGITLDEYGDDFEVWPLRGDLRSFDDLGHEFDQVEPGTFKAIFLDAKYRFLPEGASENDNAAETQFYNAVDHHAERLGAPFFMVHHSSKGDQSGKRVTDVGAGAGAQSRAADCHLVLREHEDPGSVVLEAAVRSFAPVEPLVLRWQFPLWLPDQQADAGKLLGLLSPGDQKKADEDRRAKLDVIDALRESAEPLSNKQIRKKTGMGRERLSRLLDALESDGQIESAEATKGGNRCDVFWIPDTPE